jgi:hypothetical protein
MTSFYYTFSNGEKWITLSGRGDNPSACDNTKWDTSQGNADMREVNRAQSAYHPFYGIIDLNENKNNLYIQIMRMTRLVRLGYNFESTNFPDIKILKVKNNDRRKARK